MSAEVVGIIVAGALLGGFVNGLTGFGTGLTAIGLWLYVLPAPVAASLVIATSILAQVQNAPLIWRRIDWPRTLPFVIPALAAVPLGASILSIADGRAIEFGVGLFLVLYATVALARSEAIVVSWGGRPADAGVGFASGLLGGLAGLSGPLMALWADLRGGGKEARRTLLQTFNLVVLVAALAGHAVAGHLTREVGYALLAALPGTVLGALAGAAVYRRMGDRGYRRAVLALLLLNGCCLVLFAGLR